MFSVILIFFIVFFFTRMGGAPPAVDSPGLGALTLTGAVSAQTEVHTAIPELRSRDQAPLTLRQRHRAGRTSQMMRSGKEELKVTSRMTRRGNVTILMKKERILMMRGLGAGSQSLLRAATAKTISSDKKPNQRSPPTLTPTVISEERKRNH